MSRKPTLDELAASLSPDVLQANGLTLGRTEEDIQKEQAAMEQARIAKSREPTPVSFVNDWSKKAPEDVHAAVGRQAERNPADLNKAVFSYQNRIKYNDNKQTVKAIGYGEIPLTWTEEDLDRMEEIEKSEDPKYNNFLKW